MLNVPSIADDATASCRTKMRLRKKWWCLELASASALPMLASAVAWADRAAPRFMTAVVGGRGTLLGKHQRGPEMGPDEHAVLG